MDSPALSTPHPLGFFIRPIPFTSWCTPRFLGKLLLIFVIIGLLNLTAQNLIYFDYEWFFVPATFLSAWLLLWLVFRRQTRNWHDCLRPKRFRDSLPLAMITLILCIACAEMWNDSYTDATHGWSTCTATSDQKIQCCYGQFVCWRLTYSPSASFPPLMQEPWKHHSYSSPLTLMQNFAMNLPWHGQFPGRKGSGFAWAVGIPANYQSPAPYATIITFPCWLPILLTAIFPLWWLGRFTFAYRVHRLIRENRCVHCHYDLRASPEQCPECGTITLPSAAHA